MAVTADHAAAGVDAGRLARIDEHFRGTYVDTGRIAGCQVLVGRRGQVVHRATIGSMDLETGEQLHDQTIWRWYSMTKPVTAVALLSLVEQARVKLTDPIHRYLPEWRDVKVSVRNSAGTFDLVDLDRPISVKHALMHMTGIGPGPKGARLDMQSLLGGRSSRTGREAATLADLSELLAGEPLRFQPGTRWFYSWSSDICARLVEVIAGEQFGSYLQRTIFDPLGMDDTGFHADEADAHRVPSLYARGPSKEMRLVDDRTAGRLCREPTLQSGGGGLVGTIDDYARFCQMLTGGGVLDGTRVLGRPTVELMRTNHLPGGGQLPRLRHARWLRRGRLRRQRIRPAGGRRARAGGHVRSGARRRLHVGRRRLDRVLDRPDRGPLRRLHDPDPAERRVRLPWSVALTRLRRDCRLISIALGRPACLTPAMDETDDAVEIDVTIETEVVDVDGDGIADVVSETTTTTIDVDGDGIVDIIEVTTTTGYDLDGDGEVDVIESTTVTGIDVDGDGEFDDDEIEVEEIVAVREDLVDDAD